MNKPHIHCDLIKLWADGAEIQYYDKPPRKWYDTSDLTWGEDIEYRVKPEPYEAWVNVYKDVQIMHSNKRDAEMVATNSCIRTVHVREVEE